MQRRTKAPETNSEQLGGEGPRDEVQYRLRQRGIVIENAGPPLPGVTRLEQDREGLHGLFNSTLRNLKEHQQRRRQPHDMESMNKYLQDGGLSEEDR
jgi:hypothetical protein